MATYNKFEELAIRKQDMAYKVSFAKKNFAWSCDQCCSKNLRGGRGTCASCPIKEAHIRALTEIQSGIRTQDNERIQYGAKKLYNNHGPVTIVINFH